MTIAELDTGKRCDEHVGEVFPPRCSECEVASTPAPVRRYKRYVPGSECPLHRGYPMPCDRCERDAADVGFQGSGRMMSRHADEQFEETARYLS